MRFSPSYSVQLLLLFLLCPFRSQAQHCFISFYPDTARYSLAAATDAKGEFDGEYISFWKNGNIMDSGEYRHGIKTGYWISRDPGGVYASQEWYDGIDSVAVRARTFSDKGIVRNTIERKKDATGEIYFLQRFSGNKRLSESKIIYTPPRNGIASFSKQLGPLNDQLKGQRFILHTQYANGTSIDSMYDEAGMLRCIRTEDYEWQYYDDGSRESYNSRDTECTWFDNGQLFLLSVKFKPNRILAPASQGGEIQPSGFTRYWARDGFLIQENYDYPLYLPLESRVRLCNENGKVYAEGLTDSKGLKDGSWRYYAYTASGDQYTVMEGAYRHGSRTGPWRSLYESGQIKSTISYDTYTEKVFRQSLYNSFSPRGECDKLTVLKSRKQKIKASVNVIAGQGIIYFPNGKKRVEFNSDTKGDFDGRWSLYDSSGAVISSRIYRHGQLCDSSWWSYPSGRLCRIVYYDSLGTVTKTKTFDPEKNGQLLSAADAAKTAIPYDPLWLYILHTDGLGKSYIGTNKKGRADYRNMQLYKKKYQGKKQIELTPPASPWVKEY